MKPEIIRRNEVNMNKIMFLVLVAVPVAAFLFVLLFLKGTAIDLVVFLMAVLGGRSQNL